MPPSTRPPPDLIPAPNSNELARPHIDLQDNSSGAQMFSGASDVTIHGGEFNAVDHRIFTINNYNVFPSTISQEHVARLAVHSDTREILNSGIENGMQSLHDADSRFEQEVSSPPFTSAPLTVLPWPESRALMDPIFHERVASIFHDSLLVAKRGIPLWMPCPNRELPISYRRKGVSIGDLGLVTEFGGFEYLFNITLPIHHPDNPTDLPHDLFSPSLSAAASGESIRTYEDTNPFRNFASTGVSVEYSQDGSGVSFKCSASSATHGAVLVLPLGFTSYDLSNNQLFRKILLDNALKWYGYGLSQIGSRARNGNLCLITGCDRCQVCGLAAFEMKPSGSIDCLFETGPEVRGIQTYRWRRMQAPASYQQHKTQPGVADILQLRGDEISEQGRIYENLCTFVRTMNVRVREDLWTGLRSASDSQYVPQFSSVPEGGGGTSNAANETQCHSRDRGQEFTRPVSTSPGNTINEYLLKVQCAAKIAVTWDEQWMRVLRKDDSQFPDSDELIQRILDKYTVGFEDGVVFLEQKTSDSGSVAQNAVPDTVAPEQKTPLADGGEHDSTKAPNHRLPNISSRVGGPKLSTTSLKGGHSFGTLVSSPDSDNDTLHSEEFCETPCSSVGSFQSLGGTGAKVDEFSTRDHRRETGDVMLEPPLPTQTQACLTDRGHRR